MTKKDIIENLAHDKKIRKIAQNIAGAKGLGDDLYQYLFLTLLEKPEAKIIEAHEKKYLDFLCITIMQNSYHSFSSPFAVQYRQHIGDSDVLEIELHTSPDIEEATLKRLNDYEELIEPLEAYLHQPITQDNFFKLILLRDWVNGESYRKIAARTKIPMRSVASAIQQALNEIRETL